MMTSIFNWNRNVCNFWNKPFEGIKFSKNSKIHLCIEEVREHVKVLLMLLLLTSKEEEERENFIGHLSIILHAGMTNQFTV